MDRRVELTPLAEPLRWNNWSCDAVAPPGGGPRTGATLDPAAYVDYGFSIDREHGELIYSLCRALHAIRVAEFATSLGASTRYFAAALRDTGGGEVIGSETVPEKVAAAQRHFAAAGLL